MPRVCASNAKDIAAQPRREPWVVVAQAEQEAVSIQDMPQLVASNEDEPQVAAASEEAPQVAASAKK